MWLVGMEASTTTSEEQARLKLRNTVARHIEKVVVKNRVARALVLDGDEVLALVDGDEDTAAELQRYAATIRRNDGEQGS